MDKKTHDIDWKGKKQKRANIQSFVRKFLLFPDFWEDRQRFIGEKLTWNSVKFDEKNVSKIPTQNGLYCFLIVPPNTVNIWDTKYLFYIGKASSVSLRSRFKIYLNEKNGIGIGDQKPRIKVEEMLNDYDGYVFFHFTDISEKVKICEYEEKLLRIYMPYVNTHHPEAQITEEYRHIY